MSNQQALLFSNGTYLLEVWPGSSDLMHQIFDTKNVVFAERFLDNTVVGQGNALFVNLAISALVDQLADRFQVRLAEKG